MIHGAAPLKDAFGDAISREQAWWFGLILFLISLAIIFASTVVGLVVLRVQLQASGQWPELPVPPWALGVSTVVLLVSGGTMHAAVRAARDDDRGRTRRFLWITGAIGVAFLLLQALAIWRWFDEIGPLWDTGASRAAAAALYLLTGLHAAHVIGGLAVLAFTARKAALAVSYAPGVRRCAAYWHFLDVMWLALYGMLLLW